MKLIQIAINKIKPDKNQPRELFDKTRLLEIGQSLKTTGIINPIEIDENNVIITGECRWRAGKLAKLKTVPVIVKTGLSQEERIVRQLSENLARQTLTVPEQIKGIDKLIRLSRRTSRKSKSSGGRPLDQNSISGIARQLGVSEVWIRNLLQIKDAPKKIQKAVDDFQKTKGEKGFSASKAIEIIKLEDKAEQVKIADQILKGEIEGGHKSIRELVNEKKRTKEIKEKYDEGKKSQDEEIQIIKATEVIKSYRKELNGFLKSAKSVNYQIKKWNNRNHSWFDKKSNKEFVELMNYTEGLLYTLLEDVKELRKTLG